MRSIRALVLFGLLAVASTATAEEWPELDGVPPVDATGNGDVAVVVAIEDYAFLPDVPGATKNAADWERFLADGLGVSQVLMLTNQQATREEILTFAHRAANATDDDGTLWFVFIGHGGPAKDGSDGLLIGADGQQNAKSMSVRGVAQRELMGVLEKGSQQRTVVLIDACFSGRDGSGAALAKGTMPVLPVNPTPTLEGETVVMTAAKADEFAGDLPGAERPAFSYLVLGAMRGWADDGDGTVTVDEAVTFARRELLEVSGRQQTPQLAGAKSLVLTTGVRESRPRLRTPTPVERSTDPDPSPRPDAGVSDTAAPEDPKLTDGVPDNPFYAFAGVGPGVVDNVGDFGVLGDFGVGAKLNGFTGGPNEWRLGLRVGLGSTPNSSAPGEGDVVSGGEVFSDDTVQDASTFAWVLGPELGRGWRSESGGGLFGDTTLVVSVFGLYGNRPSVCDTWQLDTASGSREISCENAMSESGPGAGASAAASLGFLRISAQFAYLADIDVFGSLTAGLTFDI